ncbi:MAG: hypothetical protein AAGI72_02655 [Pseudomonadota bacterium]
MATADAQREIAGRTREVGRFAGIDIRQWIKIVVYSLLLVNFVHYLGNDINVARHTVHDGWKLHDWTSAFATTLDESAWFLLLLLLELETYLLSDEAFTRGRVVLMHALRLVCFLAIGHTVFAFADYLLELSRSVEHVGVELCSFAEAGISFARNLDYVELDASNCALLSDDTTFYQFAQGQALTDRAGWPIEWQLAWADLVEVVVWLFILAMIEVMVRLQEKGITTGSTLRFAQTFNAVLYGVLWLLAAYWAFRGHWVFAWDEALWILGFMAIGMNLSQWREEIEALAET